MDLIRQRRRLRGCVILVGLDHRRVELQLWEGVQLLRQVPRVRGIRVRAVQQISEASTSERALRDFVGFLNSPRLTRVRTARKSSYIGKCSRKGEGIQSATVPPRLDISRIVPKGAFGAGGKGYVFLYSSAKGGGVVLLGLMIVLVVFFSWDVEWDALVHFRL